ncbi:MAG: DNA polymerase III subunit gamma/tau [Pseudomonadota bacterium]|nr:DNA polymerase III subunit gamma/tau [Pseudomonadota bacterium]
MAYEVLARKWRPDRFATMVGQEHVLRALVHALEADRLHHAYLFTGTRGVGKTTVARILARCLNCEQGVGPEPCGVCPSCVEIAEGRFVDLIEVDAASRTKVEDTRELLDNVQYAPTRGRYKVYLIDEVHMLSTSSFNALLKTLEEPPPHVKFLLATTDPKKLPVTVLSRCLQFHLKNMTPERIVGHLQHVLGEEAVEFEDAALSALARAADGSMRDALSLTDQAVAHGGGKLVADDVARMLGTIDQGALERILDALAHSDGQALVACCDDLAIHAADFANVLKELMSALHQVALAQALPNGPHAQDLRFTRAAQKLSPEDVQLCYQIALTGLRDLPWSPDPRSGFEMTLLRMLAFKPASAGHSDGGPGDGGGDGGGQRLGANEGGEPANLSAPAERSGGAIADTPISGSAPRPEISAARVRSGAAVALDAASAETRSDGSAAATPPRLEAAPATAPAGASEIDEARAFEPPRAAGSGESAAVRDGDELRASEGAAVIDAAAARSEPESDGATAEAIAEAIGAEIPGAEPPSLSVEGAAVTASAKPDVEAQPESSQARDCLDLCVPSDWHAVLEALELTGMTRELAAHGLPTQIDGSRVELTVSSQAETLIADVHVERIEKALARSLGTEFKVRILAGDPGGETPSMRGQRARSERQAQAVAAIENDPGVALLRERFGAIVQSESIRPLS